MVCICVGSTQRTNYFIVVGRHFCLNGGSNFAAAKVLQINCSKGTVNNDYVFLWSIDILVEETVRGTQRRTKNSLEQLFP